MAKAKTNSSKPDALVVLNTATKLAPAKIAELQQRIGEQLEHIARNEREIPLRAIFAGFALHAVKNSLPYREFGAWQTKCFTQGKTWTPATAKKNASFYMRLAMVALEECGLKKPEIAGDSLALALRSPEEADRKLVAALTKFVGDRSLNELLREHGIKDAKALGGARKTGDDNEPEAPDAEQLYLFARDEIGGVLQRAEELLVKENRLQHLIAHPEEVRGVVASLRSLADQVEKAAKPLLQS